VAKRQKHHGVMYRVVERSRITRSGRKIIKNQNLISTSDWFIQSSA